MPLYFLCKYNKLNAFVYLFFFFSTTKIRKKEMKMRKCVYGKLCNVVRFRKITMLYFVYNENEKEYMVEYLRLVGEGYT